MGRQSHRPVGEATARCRKSYVVTPPWSPFQTDWVAGKHERRQQEEQWRALNWLSPLNFAESYEQRCDDHLEGTGTWLLESDDYITWKSSSKSDLLYIRGKPGCGKSHLAAVTITD